MLEDASGAFPVSVAGPDDAARLALFAVGAGGNPERHLPLLSALAQQGCKVVAPHHDRLPSPTPSPQQLRQRVARLRAALAAFGHPALPAVGVGHSIGAAMLLGLAGARLWAVGGHEVVVSPHPQLGRLALLAPATDFVRAPGALAAVRADVLLWAGGRDRLVPVSAVRFVNDELATAGTVALRVNKDAGHFSFMHVPPPQRPEPLDDREAFLAEMTAAVCRFVLGGDP